MDNLLEIIRGENLSVYRNSPQRLREDIGQEGEIAQNYRGRLIYELLQNADDAIGATASSTDTVRFVVAETAIWMANSGKPLDVDDVRGLCGISASTKIGQGGKRRASIGHKGMGFKSVLEISDRPEVYSTDICFRFSLADAVRAVQPLVTEHLIAGPVTRAPITRFPWPITPPDEWQHQRADGMTTAFCFPFHTDVTAEHRERLATALRTLPVTSILFLKHLERIEIDIRHPQPVRLGWTIRRQRLTDAGWVETPNLCESGIHQITVTSDTGETDTFMVAHDANILIGAHRGGLNAVAWEGVEYTEVSVAARIHDGLPSSLPQDWKRFHVFLPTGEASPYHLLINGAFNASLSRQEVRVEQDEANYNRFLLQQAARLVRDHLFPRLLETGASVSECVKLLDRGAIPQTSNTALALYEEMTVAFRHHAWLPTEQNTPISIGGSAIPPLVDAPQVGCAFREALPVTAALGDTCFPLANLCGVEIGRILVDHGARQVTPEEAAVLLTAADPSRTLLREHPTGKLYVDPVLEILEALWVGLDAGRRERLTRAVRANALFPVDITADGTALRVITDAVTCFYPPRSWHGTLPLDGLCLLLQEICWGDLTPQERNQVLKQQMVAWAGLFDMKEFKFPEVMRASVLPSLSLDGGTVTEREDDDARLDRIAAICQLAGRTPNPNAPLPYERLGANRALFNLGRLALPCRSATPGEIHWVPAYRVYFGEDWCGVQSVERVFGRAQAAGATDLPTVEFLVSPEYFAGRLDRYRHLQRAVSDQLDVADDEVAIDEDDEVALDDNDRDRLMQFFQWLGVNVSLRPVHFHDVEDRGLGWLTTQELKRPISRAFQQIPDTIWRQFIQDTRQALREAESSQQQTVPYFYRLHTLEYLEHLLCIAEGDATVQVGQALYEHLALNWQTLEKFSHVQIARIPNGQEPTKRTKPPRARTEELIEIGADLWVYRLRAAHFCPTPHGPRCVAHIWWPSKEAQRRFARRTGTEAASYLIPVLDAPLGLKGAKARSFAQALGMREELSPSTFTLDDAQIVLTRLQQLYDDKCAREDDLRHDLREVIRPAYRHVIELLVGTDRSKSNGVTPVTALSDLPLLAQNGEGCLRFVRARDVFYLDRRDTRDRLQHDAMIWTFIIEAFPAARAPLTQLFGVQVLEETLCWEPRPGDPALDEERQHDFYVWLRHLAPYLLARVGVDHVDDQAVRRDVRGLRTLVDRIEPVTQLDVRCTLHGIELGVTTSGRDAYVHMDGSEVTCAFLVWGETVEPSEPRHAEALATACCDVLGIGYFESFLALIQARTDEERDRLLRRAGAPRDVAEKRALLFEEDSLPALEQAPLLVTEDGPKTVEAHSTANHSDLIDDQEHGTRNEQNPRVRLYHPTDLVVAGIPLATLGTGVPILEPPVIVDGLPRMAVPSAVQHRDGYGGHTDLSSLDTLGMSVVLAYELNRLRCAGFSTATVYDPAGEAMQPDALVFDISTPEKIAHARQASTRFDAAMSQMARVGVSGEWPGCDVITLRPDADILLDRLIELKSSGVASRVLEMSWNEWKTATASIIRERFYLYLVGNLRADIPGSIPFVRAYRNPFEQLQASVATSRALQRRVHLSTTDFCEAEYLDLGVQPPVGTTVGV